MDRPRIQISGDPDALENYVQAIRCAGGEPVAAYAPAPDPCCDGLLLAGGGDLDVTLFGWGDRGSHPPDPLRDRAELALFHAYLEAGKPIFGICKGLQVISAALGGDLIQDLPPEVRPFHAWEGSDKVHPVRAAEGSLLRRLYGPLFPVNSAHHQALGTLGAGLRASAWSESGFPEGVEHETLPVFGVQFHPERMAYALRRPDTVDGAPLFDHFLNLCRRRGR